MPIDLRTIFFSYILTDLVSLIVMFMLWRQSRKRFGGTIYLVFDYLFQVLCILLIFLRGHIPDFVSIDVSNTIAVTGAVLGLIGLEYFTDKKSNQLHNYLLIAAFFCVHTYFTYVKPDLAIRNLNSAVAYLLICSQCAWLLLKRVSANFRKLAQGVAIVFVLFSSVNIIRIIEFFISQHTASDYLHAGIFETFVIISYQLLFILLTFMLSLMINKRLMMEIALQEEKFSKAFHSVPYAIILTRLSDGHLLEVNEGFEKITSFSSSEVIGKTTLDLKFWANVPDRELLVKAIEEKGKVKEMEVGLRKKSGEHFTGQISSELITLNSEACILSVIVDVTQRSRSEKALKESEAKFRELFVQMNEGFALHEVIYDESDNAIDYKIIDINPAFEKQVGISAEKANGTLATELYGVSPAPYLDVYAKVAEIGEPSSFQTYFPPLNKHFEISVFSPNPGFFATIFTDITERMEVEKTLKQSEAKFKNLVIDMQVGVLLQGPHSEILMSNPKALELLGITEDQLLGKTSFDPDWNVIHEDGSPFPGSTHPVPEAIATSKSVHDVIMGVFRPSIGDRVWLKVDAELQYNDTGTVEQVVCSFIDITKRKEAEEAQLETNAYLENLINYANSPIIVWDNRFKISRFNHAFEFITGLSEAEVKGQSLEILFPSELKDHSMALIRKTVSGERWEVVEIEIQHIDGTIHTLLWNSAAIYSPDGKTVIATIAQGQNITNRKQAEEKMYKANRLYAVISQVNQVIVHVRDRNRLLEEVCRIAIEYGEFSMAWVGLIDSETQFVNPLAVAGNEDGYLSIIRKISVNDKPEGRGPTGTAIREGKHYVCNDIVSDQNMVLWKDEAIKRGYRSLIALPIKLFGKVIGAFSLYASTSKFFDQQEIELLTEIANDVSFALDTIETEKEHQEAIIALTESEEKFRLITENASDVIWILNLTSQMFTYTSPAILQLRGITVEEALEEKLSDALTPESLAQVNNDIGINLQKFLNNPEEPDYYITQIQQPCKDGRIIWVEVSTKLRFNVFGEVEVVGVSRNIDERKRMEAEIIHSEAELRELNATKDKFFSIIAHDLKSPFNSFLGYTELMVDELDNMSLKQIQAIAVDMKRSANYLYGLLENLLQWSRIQRGISGFDPSKLKLKTKVEDSINAVTELASKKGIAITISIPDELEVFADSNMLESIIRNLTTNAVKFSPRGGKVIINAKSGENNFIEISIVDTGIGMNNEMLVKLFQLDEQTSRKGTDGEPSTGLGLIICKDFIEKHGGKIWVESKEDEGSAFYFTIPVEG
jgi:PAS domain S-box-containing protein